MSDPQPKKNADLKERFNRHMKANELVSARDDLLAFLRRGEMPARYVQLWLRACEQKLHFSLADDMIDFLRNHAHTSPGAWSLISFHTKLRADWHGCLEALERCEQLGFWNSELALNRAISLEKSLQPEATLAELDRAPELDTDARSWVVRLLALSQLKRYREAIDTYKPKLEAAAESGAEDRYIGNMWLTLGRMHDKLGEYEQAWQCFEYGNRIQDAVEGTDFATNGFRRTLELDLALYSSEWYQSWTPTPPAEKEPVFLIGFPRSGTTLLEQMLDAHPGVHSIEEKPTVELASNDMHTLLQVKANLKKELSRNMSWRDKSYRVWRMMADLSEDEIRKLRARYEEVVHSFVDWDGSRTLVDKMPLNIASIGAILRLYPNARFIVALRHPCDCVLSSFMQGFQLNTAMANFVDIHQAARFYRQTMRVLWRAQEAFDLSDRMLYIRYEDVLEDQERELTRVLRFMDLDWDPAVAEYHEHARNRGTLNTPSYEGVTQQLYTRASGRWHRYAPWLEPVLPELEEACRRYGYSLEVPEDAPDQAS